MAKKLKAERREAQKNQPMKVSGKSVFVLAKLIRKKTKKRPT